MRNWIIGLILALNGPYMLSAQSVSYQANLQPGEIVLNISGSGNYVQRGNIARLEGQLTGEAASIVDADALNQQNYDLLVNSLGMLGVGPTQIRKTKADLPIDPAATQARSVWLVSVELYDQSRISEITSAMEGADVRSIKPPAYDVVDRAALLTAARQRAIEDAKRQADAYATALTMVVRRMSRLNEKSADVATQKASSEGYNEGDVVASANIDVDFILGPMFGVSSSP